MTKKSCPSVSRLSGHSLKVPGQRITFPQTEVKMRLIEYNRESSSHGSEIFNRNEIFGLRVGIGFAMLKGAGDSDCHAPTSRSSDTAEYYSTA
jgi:hypothetical protein